MEKSLKPDIHKAGGILIRDRRLLVERSRGKEFFIAPGGSIEPGETPEQALVRELAEEFSVVVRTENLRFFGTFLADAAGQVGKMLQMDVYLVDVWEGEPTPSSEVEVLQWIASTDVASIPVGSIFAHEVIPRLVEANLID